MKDLLFLAHRIPYPPNKGDKIRSFHLLEFLSRRYRVHLGAFFDRESDARYRDVVGGYCATSWFGRLAPGRAKLRSLIGLLTGEALTLPYYRQARLTQWIRKVCADYPVRRVLVYSSAMAQYALRSDFNGTRRVIDFVDVDSEKWRQYSRSKGFPMDWVYRREWRRLGAFERRIAKEFDACMFVSEREAELFRQTCIDGAGAIVAVPNGVNADYFAPDPLRHASFAAWRRLVFTGAMDYWANVEGVTWFAHDVFPTIRAACPGTEFYIVGMNPTAKVRELGRLPGVVVTGGVADIRPYLQDACVVVIPLRIARGIQNKVLEAMAMGRPVVTTPQALEGIGALANREVLVAGQAREFAGQVIKLLDGDGAAMGRAARAFVQREFSWEANLPKVIDLIEGAA